MPAVPRDRGSRDAQRVSGGPALVLQQALLDIWVSCFVAAIHALPSHRAARTTVQRTARHRPQGPIARRRRPDGRQRCTETRFPQGTYSGAAGLAGRQGDPVPAADRSSPWSDVPVVRGMPGCGAGRSRRPVTDAPWLAGAAVASLSRCPKFGQKAPD